MIHTKFLGFYHIGVAGILVKFRGNRSTGSREEDFYKRFLPLRARQLSCTCDKDAANKLLSPYPWRPHTIFGFDWPSGLGDV